MKATVYSAFGPVSGHCGHSHHSIPAAIECIKKGAKLASRKRKDYDRKVVAIDRVLTVTVRPLTQDELNAVIETAMGETE